jgi:signal transduction histidine kinase
MMIEPINLRALLEEFRTQWPGIALTLDRDATVQADARALECILRNIIQNSIVHGHASVIHFRCVPSGKECVRITIRDNGTGFSGDARALGKLFGRIYPGSGNGIGLYLVRKLARRMGGSADFYATDGFSVELELRGDTKT